MVHIKVHQEDLQGAITAVRLATLMRTAGARVTIFLSLRGVRIADTRTPQDLFFGRDTELPSGTDLTLGNVATGFLDAGGKIAVCPACANEVGLTPDYLIGNTRQVTIIAPDALAQLLLKADKILDF